MSIDIVGLTNGFKKKCLSELKAARKLGLTRPMTEEEIRECNQSAAESVKKRFEKNQVLNKNTFILVDNFY